MTKRNRPSVEVMVSLQCPCEACGIFCLEGQKAMKCLASKNLISGLSAAEVGRREEWQFVVSAVLKNAGVRNMVVFGPSFGVKEKTS